MEAPGWNRLFSTPVNSEESIYVSHPQYELPYETGKIRNDVPFKVTAGETLERLLVLQKRENAQPKDDK